mmetsp:Transcript_44851/g.106426  ORF Transcript_44851/g.106426 Transcript_44851/m.106426 type:complete len:85 (+) Transcript_44851:122-376(+)
MQIILGIDFEYQDVDFPPASCGSSEVHAHRVDVARKANKSFTSTDCDEAASYRGRLLSPTQLAMVLFKWLLRLLDLDSSCKDCK